MRIFASFKRVIICSAFISVICFFFGIVASYAFDTPAGASIVAVNMVAFGICSLVGFVAKRV
jgi:ABC-type Mn2+/Zn2+ transport system permease subunit